MNDDLLKRHLDAAVRARAGNDEAIIRDLLSRWISELEPAVARHHKSGEIIGLTHADAPPGCKPFILRRTGGLE